MGYHMKIKSIILISLLLLVMVFGFVGCLPVDDDNSSSSSDDNTPIEPEVFTFKLMCFNMRVQVGSTADKRVEYDTVDARAPLILKHIADADPDVICVQEWTGAHMIHVQPELEEVYEVLTFERDLSECAAICYKRDRFELVDTEHFWLSETKEEYSAGWDAVYPRIYSAAILRDKKNGKVFRAGTTHIDIAEIAQVEQRNIVVQHTANSSEPALICGDFNFNTISKLYPYCTEYLDDCRLLAPNAVTTASYNGYDYDKTILDKDGNVIDGKGTPIDHIFVKRGAFTVHSYDVLNYLIEGKFSSDHFPLVVELKIND